MKLLTVLLLYSGFSVFLGYSSIAPFFPSELSRRGLNPLLNSIVFSLYALTFVGCSLFVSKIIIPTIGRSFSFFIGALSQILSLTLLGLLNRVSSNSLFLILAIVARLLQGAGTSIMVILIFAFISVAYPNKLEMFHSLTQICFAVGIAVSPFASTFLYN